jgi:D-inositol-3-phosphate glycosyltransferase
VVVKMLTGLPLVATTCGGDVQVLPEIGYGDRLKPRFDRLVRANSRRADVIGCVNANICEELNRMGATARVVQIPNGVSWSEFQTESSALLRRRLGLPADAIVVLSVGRNQPVKGFDLGIRAFAHVIRKFPQAVYVLIGRDTSSLAGLVSELNLDGRVHLLEQMLHSELPETFRSADVFFSPSLIEGFSQVNVQAMACGLPCVLTDVPGNRDTGAAGGAIIARSRDIVSMASSIGSLLGDPEGRRRLGAEAHELSRQFSWSRISEGYLKIFDELCTSPK